MSNQSITIVGGGISGLSTAYYLEKAGYTNITLLEASNRLGGVLHTMHDDRNNLLETGAESFAANQPVFKELLSNLGLDTQLMEPKNSTFYIAFNGVLKAPPGKSFAMVPTDLEDFFKSDFYSEQGQLDILNELDQPKRIDGEDESLEDFILRRFGEEVFEKYATPLYAGIQSTPASELSMQAYYPHFLKWEREYGSITGAIHDLYIDADQPIPTLFNSLQHGLGSLITGLEQKLQHTKIITGKGVQSLSVEGDTYVLQAENEVFKTNQVICTTPAHITASILSAFDALLTEQLNDISFTSSAVITLVFDPKDVDEQVHKMSGFMIGKGEEQEVSAYTFSTSKWENRSEAQVIIRGYVPSPFCNKYSDEELVAITLKTLAKYIEVGTPVTTHINAWKKVRPQYTVGHLERMSDLFDQVNLYDGLHLTGSSYYGAGITKCVVQAQELVEGKF